MAKKESVDSRYESKYGGGWVTPAQIIAELMCERMARTKGQTLNPKFWKEKEWKNTFLWQLKEANKLLKLYSPKAVSSAVRSPEGRKFLSLSNPTLQELIKKEDTKYKQQISSISEEKIIKAPEKIDFVKKQEKPNILSKLRSIDNG